MKPQCSDGRFLANNVVQIELSTMLRIDQNIYFPTEVVCRLLKSQKKLQDLGDCSPFH